MAVGVDIRPSDLIGFGIFIHEIFPCEWLMQDFLIGPVGLLENLADLLFDLGGGAGGLWDVLDQIARILQQHLDLGHALSGSAGGHAGRAPPRG